MLRATFPAGTVSGAPKVRAMEIIDSIEPTKRGPYAGVVGYIDFSGNLDTAIAIRTMIWRNGRASVQAGAGIVPTRFRKTKTSSATTRRGRCSPPPPRHVVSRRSVRSVHERRIVMSNELALQLELLRADAAIVDRPGRGAVLVAGPDAVSFLQALVSADLDPLGDGDGVHSLLLTPQGKLDVDFRLLRVGDDVWLDTDPDYGPRLAASLERFRIRVKADVTDRSGEWQTFSLIGPRVFDRFANAPMPAALHAHVAWSETRVVRTSRGLDVVGPRVAVAAARDQLVADGWPAVGPVAFEAFRIETGVPRQPDELDDSTIPQEAFLERDAVSFTKGCFLGQELVCRIDSRGHVNRFLRKLVSIDGPLPVRGAEIVVDGKVVGTVTSAAPPELAVGALGYVRREVEPPATAELRGPDGVTTVRVEALF